MDTGISYSTTYGEFSAAIAAGATLDELLKWERNEYPLSFKAKVVAWHNLSALIDLHGNDAVMRKQDQEARAKKR